FGLAQRAERLRQWNAWIGPMQQQKIDFPEPQLRETFLGGANELARREMRRPHLGDDEHFVARDARGAQPFSHLALIVIHLSGVDVAIAKPQRLFNDTRADTPAQIPGAEPEQRNACAICFDDLHGSPPLRYG